MGEIPIQDPKLARALNSISGSTLEGRINELASIASIGKIGEGGSRLGLSSAEPQARQLLTGWMNQAGMRVTEHPLGLVGYYSGLDSHSSPVASGSHHDTVPSSGKFDGPAGTISAITVVEALHQEGLRFRRPLAVYAFTLEESSRFNVALLGSRAMTHGLTEAHLSLRDSAGISLAEAIRSAGSNPDQVRTASIKRRPYAFIEMHIEQGPYLSDSNLQIGAVEAIAATNRQEVIIGKDPVPKVDLSTHTESLSFTVNGQAGHSGGTPMGKAFRADGLVPTAHFLEAAYQSQKNYKGEADLHVMEIDVEGQALNKIPGKTTTTVLVSGEDALRVADFRHSLANILDGLNGEFSKRDYPKFNGRALDIHAPVSVNASAEVFDPSQIWPLYRTAAGAIMSVQQVVEQYAAKKTVGTVGTLRQLPSGILELGVDIRGVDGEARSQALNKINRRIDDYSEEDNIVVSINPLPSITRASLMNPELVNLVETTAKALGLKVVKMPSGPGHDAQNFVERGIPTGMIFIPSRNGGISHNPAEYSTPQDLENGAKVLAAVVAHLAR